MDDENNNSYNYLRYNIKEILRRKKIEDELLIYPLMNHYVIYNSNSFNYPLMDDENNIFYNYIMNGVENKLIEIIEENNSRFKVRYRYNTYYIFDLWTLTEHYINIW